MAKKQGKKAVGVARGKPAERDVDGFLDELDHPLKKDIERVGEVIRGESPAITELIKWNSLSFRASNDFATVNLRSRDAVQLVFHTGVKKKANPKRPTISDPSGLIKWLAPDRCLVTLGSGKEIEKNKTAFGTIVREWIEQMEGSGGQ